MKKNNDSININKVKDKDKDKDREKDKDKFDIDKKTNNSNNKYNDYSNTNTIYFKKITPSRIRPKTRINKNSFNNLENSFIKSNQENLEKISKIQKPNNREDITNANKSYININNSIKNK